MTNHVSDFCWIFQTQDPILKWYCGLTLFNCVQGHTNLQRLCRYVEKPELGTHPYGKSCPGAIESQVTSLSEALMIHALILAIAVETVLTNPTPLRSPIEFWERRQNANAANRSKRQKTIAWIHVGVDWLCILTDCVGELLAWNPFGHIWALSQATYRNALLCSRTPMLEGLC